MKGNFFLEGGEDEAHPLVAMVVTVVHDSIKPLVHRLCPIPLVEGVGLFWVERACAQLSEELVMLRHGLVILRTTHPPRNVHDLPRVQDGHIPRDGRVPFLALEQVVLGGVTVVPRHMYPICTRTSSRSTQSCIHVHGLVPLSKTSP